MNPELNPRKAATLERSALDPTTLVRQLLRYAKHRAQWRTGLEYEVIGFRRSSFARIAPHEVQAVMSWFCRQGGEPVREDGAIIAASMPYGDITLEPGGQIELSASPTATIGETEHHVRRFLSELHAYAADNDMLFLGIGFDPLRTLSEQRWIQKQRYAIMRPYLRTRGGHAWNMMVRTAAIQVSIDYADGADLARKYVLGNRAAPFVAAMFANSPFADGRPTGLKSTRYASWLDTDPDRTGPGFGSLDGRFDLRRYVDDVLQVPLFFVQRGGRLRDVAGQRLADLADAQRGDFEDLLSMIFTEARLRRYIELRSADSGSVEYALALVALWKGLTYADDSLSSALETVPLLEPSAYRALQMAVAKEGLAARYEGVVVLSVARALLAIARSGLASIAPEELSYLEPLWTNVVDRGVSPADLLLAQPHADVRSLVQASAVA